MYSASNQCLMKRYQPSKMSIEPVMRAKYNRFSGILLGWLYSLSRPRYCETLEEYELSKLLLYAFIRSLEVQAILSTKQNVNTIDDWVHSNIVVKENGFLYYQRKHLRYYYQATTSPHEGTNHGIKSHAACTA